MLCLQQIKVLTVTEWSCHKRNVKISECPVSQHWLARTRRDWHHQPGERLLSKDSQPSGNCATMRIAWRQFGLLQQPGLEADLARVGLVRKR